MTEWTLKAARKARRLTLRQMADQAQIGFTRYCAIESGKERAKANENSAIAWVLQSNPEKDKR